MTYCAGICKSKLGNAHKIQTAQSFICPFRLAAQDLRGLVRGNQSHLWFVLLFIEETAVAVFPQLTRLKTRTLYGLAR